MVVPGVRVARDRLLEEDLVAIVEQLAACGRGDDHRHEPQSDREQHRAEPGEPEAADAQNRGPPASPHEDHERHERKERQEADTFRDHAEAGRGPAEEEPAGRRAEAEVAQEAVQAECREETQGGVDLRHACLPHELEREEQDEARGKARLPAAGTAHEVVGEEHRAEAGEQRRQQETDAQRPGDRGRDGDQPEEDRRFVSVEVAAHARYQPVARAQHVLRDERETGLVRRPGVAEPEPGRHQQQAEREEPEEVERDVALRVAARAQQPVEPRRRCAPGVSGHAVSSVAGTRGEARRMSHITPKRSTIPTQRRLCSPYFDLPRVRSR